MSNDTGICASRNGSKMAQNQAYMQHLPITQGSYELFPLDPVRYAYDTVMYRRNSDEVEIMARNTAILLIFAAHIRKT